MNASTVKFLLSQTAKSTLLSMIIASNAVWGSEGNENRTNTSEDTQWPATQSPIKMQAAMENKISALIKRMSVEEKVGQIIQPRIQYISPEEIRTYHIGSILNGGGSLPNRNKYATPAEWLAMADAFYGASMDDRDGKVTIPILWGSDAVHGHNNVIGATIFPHNIGLGAMYNPSLMRKIGEITAREMRVTGIDWTFAPTLAVVQDDRWGRTYESYSEDPALVASYAAPFVKGLQGEPGTAEFLDGNHVIATAKHFVGDGGTEGGDDQGDARISELELRDIHAAGYFPALSAGVQTAMASFSAWNGTKIHGSKYLMNDILKEQIGFDGPVVGDWNAHGQVPGCSNASCPASINAGLDIFMAPQDWKALFYNTVKQVENSEISMARMDDAVRRILRMKFRSGLFEKPKPSARGLAGKEGVIGSKAHRMVAREAVRQSLVLLKNKGKTLPIKPNSTILLVGDGAHNIGKQSGGWTISWQGTGNTNEDFPGGQSIYDGIKEAVEATGGTVILDIDGTQDVKADVAIAVFGENPYAEFQGDRDTLEFQPGNKAALNLLKSLKKRNLPVVSVFLSGRPMWVNPELNASDAFVAAWLPGSEGGGLADILIANENGKPRYDFTGTLSFSWPKTPLQGVLNPHHSDYDPLFPLAYGLNYNSTDTDLASLPEDVDGVQTGLPSELNIYASRPLEPWRVYIASDGSYELIVSGAYAKLADETIIIKTTDKDVQEDALSVTWTGEKTGYTSITGGGVMDLSEYAKTNGLMTFDIKLDAVPAGEINLSMKCENGCTNSIRLTDHLRALVNQSWQKVSVKLNCFDQDLEALKTVTAPFTLTSTEKAQISFANIKIEAAGSAVFNCTAPD